MCLNRIKMKPRRGSNYKEIMFIDSIFFVSLLAFFGILIGLTYHSDGVSVLALGSNNANNISLANLIKEGSPHLGSTSAAVTLIDFSDFQCHLCARYAKATEPKINDTYIQTGKVNLVFKNLPNRGSDSMGAAIAAQCH